MVLLGNFNSRVGNVSEIDEVLLANLVKRHPIILVRN